MKPHRFTLLNDPELETSMQQALEAISAEIAALPESRFVDSVLLGGGYGRGEGGVATDAQGKKVPYNDLDFFVFSSASGRKRREADAALRGLSERWHHRIGIDVDFAPARSWGSLRSVTDTVMYQELRSGFLPVYGDDGSHFLKSVTAKDSKDLPQLEAMRLLLNRGTGLLLAERAWRSPERETQMDFICRNLHKCALGCGDALLLNRGEYNYAIEGRRQMIAALPNQWQLLRNAYFEAVAFKAAPVAQQTDVSREIGMLKEQWLRVLVEMVGREINFEVDPVGVKVALLQRWLRQGDSGKCKNLLLNICYLRDDVTLRTLFVAPQIHLLPKLYALLFAKDNTSDYIMQQNGYDISFRSYMNLWRRFN